MKLFSRLILIVTVSCTINPPVWAKKGVNDAVVKIYTVYNRYDCDEPWQMLGQRRRSGSGCIISARRILTSAHVVGDQTYIQVRRAGEAKKYTAKVEVVAHECDLAILRVSDESLFSDVRPIEIGALPEVRDKVTVYGFPKGGDELCITEGVVSRVEHREYTHSRAYLLTCQIDASINPGSSGGPVVKENKLVGVAFQLAESGENIGYMVPAPVINHFLTDIEDCKYEGTPGLGISWQRMENPDLRLRFGMTGSQSGVLVNRIYPGSPGKAKLQSEDVIISIDGKNVENDGTIEFRNGERTFFGYLAQRKFIDDMVKFKIMRENKVMEVGVRLSKPLHSWRLVPHEQYDVAPTYYILGGLVFEPLTLNFLKTWTKWYFNAPLHLINYYLHGEPTEDRRQVVVLVKVLADEINVGYHNWKNRVISYVNGKRICTIRDLVSAFEGHKGRYHIVVDEQGHQIVLDKSKVDRHGQAILKKYKINADRSEDLQPG
jgi:S1-C subfamily serine protease